MPRFLRDSCRLPAVILALALAACSGDSDERPGSELRSGPWHANVTVPGGDIRFGMEIARDAEGLTATLINGSERIRVPVVRYEAQRLDLEFPAFNNRITAELRDGTLQGTLTLVKRYGKTQVMPFVARPGSRPAPEQPLAASRDLSGRWAVTFTEEDGTRYPAVGEFSQRGNRLLGTFLTETGDYRYLGGDVHGNAMQLATFDGAHAFLFTADIGDDGALSGTFWSGTESVERWEGQLAPDATLRDATALTALSEGHDRFAFEFPDLDGNPVSLDDPRFAGKVVVVTLAGSWCPNCHDEAAFMSSIYPDYRDQGVEIVALMFEHLEDAEAAREQIRRFRDKFAIEYVTLHAGLSDKALAGEALPSLQHVLAFPTTLFIDRRGAVREIHTGFSGPGTGVHYDETRRYMTGMIDRLVAEPAPGATP